MKFNTAIARRSTNFTLHRVFIDFTKNVAMICDGFVAVYHKIKPDDVVLDTTGTPINLDPSAAEKVFKPMVKPEELVVSGVFNAELLMLAMQQLAHRDDTEHKFSRENWTSVEIYKANRGTSDVGLILTFSQGDVAAVVMSMDSYATKEMSAWRPFLADPDKRVVEVKA